LADILSHIANSLNTNQNSSPNSNLRETKACISDTFSSIELVKLNNFDELYQYFGLLDLVGEVANILDNLYIKSSNKISTYNIDFICYISQLD